MCGIVAGISTHPIAPVLLDGLGRLEYRGYDSAGMALVCANGNLERTRVVGKVAALREKCASSDIAPASTGIAHTRWATHGEVSLENAHPHLCEDEIALVHNGIIENHHQLRCELKAKGYAFASNTDSEVLAVLIHCLWRDNGRDLLQAVRSALRKIEGSCALAVLQSNSPETLIVARCGSPLVIGIGEQGHYAASDIFALLPVAAEFVALEEGDVARLSRDAYLILNSAGKEVQRTLFRPELRAELEGKRGYRHWMLKEIFEQPEVLDGLAQTCIDAHGRLKAELFGSGTIVAFAGIRHVHIAACGTSYHAALIARHWLENLTGIPCVVEVASEYRYRNPVVLEGTLFLCISQSGETADTLSSLRMARSLQGQGYAYSLAICNVADSSLTREAESVFLTRAGTEIGVASTKAFTSQLAALFMLALTLAQRDAERSQRIGQWLADFERVSAAVRQVLAAESDIRHLAETLHVVRNVLYLGRGLLFPIALEGALKLKEISYIHADAYPAGELKHGPLALVDEDMPVIAVAANDALLSKMISNLSEVRARGGKIYLFTDAKAQIEEGLCDGIIRIPGMDNPLA
ncbi:MAG: glutamine--fructose-6-phosphate transaminase (isomerizing), partial [Candidatus Eutrophobiaceae bacterium]